jgi:hypothetical protein
MYDLSTCEEILKNLRGLKWTMKAWLTHQELNEDWKTRSHNYNRQLKTYHSLPMNFGVPFYLAKVTQKSNANKVMP